MSPKKQFVRIILYALLALLVCLILFNAIDVRKHFGIVTNITPTKHGFKQATVPLTLVQHGTEYRSTDLTYIYNYTVETVTVRRRIIEICSKYNVNTPLIRRHFLYNSHNKSLYCWIRKAASTTFTKIFSEAMNRHITQNYYKEVNILAPQSLEQLKSIVEHNPTFKLIVVRHPFERLVSSYRDRIEDNTKYTDQSWIYARKIFHLTRPEIFRSNTTIGSLQRIYTIDKRLKLVPSFAEFIKWLVHVPTVQDDVHWDLYYKHCSVCNVSYNFVLKIDDHTSAEIDYVLSKIGMQKVKSYLPRYGQSSGGVTNFDMTCKYIRMLSYQTVRKLYERYKIDFELYNYNLDKYKKCIRI